MRYALLVLAFALVTACATSNYSGGRDFPAEIASQIVKGETAATQIEAWFGQPFAKSTISATQEKWLYRYTQGKATAVVGSVKTEGTLKTLDVLIEDGIVVNYTLSEGPLSGAVN